MTLSKEEYTQYAHQSGEFLLRAFDEAYCGGLTLINQERIKELDELLECNQHIVIKETGLEVDILTMIQEFYSLNNEYQRYLTSNQSHHEIAQYGYFVLQTMLGANFVDAFMCSANLVK